MYFNPRIYPYFITNQKIPWYGTSNNCIFGISREMTFSVLLRRKSNIIVFLSRGITPVKNRIPKKNKWSAKIATVHYKKSIQLSTQPFIYSIIQTEKLLKGNTKVDKYNPIFYTLYSLSLCRDKGDNGYSSYFTVWW